MTATITDRRRHSSLTRFLFYCAAAHLAVIKSNADDIEEPLFVTDSSSTAGYVQLDAIMRNMTKYEGDTLRIKCEITGYPLPRYQWHRNGVPLDAVTSHDGRHNVRTTPWGSRLKIVKLKMNDSGTYSCSGFNRFGRQTTSGELIIRQGQNPNRGFGKSDRDPLDLDFDLDGDGFDADADLPFHLDPDLAPDSHPETMGSLRPGIQSTNQGIGRFRQSDEDDDDDDDDDDGGDGDGNAGFCQPYRGATCSRFVGNKSIFVKDEYQQGQTEEKLTTAFTLLATIPGGLSTACGQFAIPAMCFHAFPLCADDDGDDDRMRPPPHPQHHSPPPPPRLRLLCREDCELLTKGPCRREYAAIEAANSRENSDSATKTGALLPDCSQPSVSNHNCVRIGITRMSERDKTCYNGTGNDYRGSSSRTVSGRTCQPWTSVINPLESNQLGISQMANLDGHNFCRNPDQSLSGPWCFTFVDDMPRRELCALEKCPILLREDDEGLAKTLIILVPCISIAIFIAILAVVVQMKRKKRSKHDTITGQTKSNKVQMSALLKDTKKKFQELSVSCVVCLEEMGEGRFGKVYRGEIVSTRFPVSVQTLAASAQWKTQAEFWNELERLAELEHPNITKVVGVIGLTTNVPKSIVHEFTSTGDLHLYLASHGRVALGDSPDSRSTVLAPRDFLNIAIQVASGMEYLSNFGYVHGDLAARSVLVTDAGTIKVSTLKYRSSAYSIDYYPLPGRTQGVPVRWLPPEAVFHDQFGPSTDIWSFGILLWEIYSLGARPFQGHSDEVVIEMIGRYVVPSCPAECPPSVFSLMVDCWHKVPSQRPGFREVLGTLRRLESELIGQTELMVCQPFVGHSRTPSNGNSYAGSSGRPVPSQLVYTVPTVPIVECTTEALVPLVVDTRSLQGPYPMLPQTYPNASMHQHIAPHGPSNQTPVYGKRPLPESLSSQQSSSPPSSLSSGQNLCQHVTLECGSGGQGELERSTANHFGLDRNAAGWMRTMYDDVVI